MEKVLNESTAYFRDKFVPFGEANVSIASSPVLYGLSVYTVFNVSWDPDSGKLYAFRLKQHYERLVNSAKIMDFHSFAEEWPWERFLGMATGLLKKNNVQEDALVRVTVFVDEIAAGTRIHGLKNSLSAYVYPIGEILPGSGAHLCISSWQRNADNSIPAKAKINGSYVNASLMKNEALLNGYDDAIALDHNGHVAESTVANLFVVKGGRLATPDTSTDILEGITRDTLLGVAKNLGIQTEERSLDRTELYKVEEAFLCGSSAGVTPVLSIDKRQIGNGSAGSITKRLAAAYYEVTHGRDKKHQHWLSEISLTG